MKTLKCRKCDTQLVTHTSDFGMEGHRVILTCVVCCLTATVTWVRRGKGEKIDPDNILPEITSSRE